MKNKKTRKKIISIIFIVIMLVIIIVPSVYARSSSKTGNLEKIENCTGSECKDDGDTFGTIMGKISEVALTASTASLASMVTMIGGLLFILLQTVFTAFGLVSGAFPMPDTILFNRVAFLDPNFLNPEKGALIATFNGVIKNVFESFRIIAIAIFIVAAMIIGIKLAISSIAAEKAKYKQAIIHWVTGILILVVLKYIISAIFIINEEIVQLAYNQAKDISFDVSLFNIIPGGYKTTGIKSIVGLFTDTDKLLAVKVHGYWGLFLKYFLQGWSGNLLSSVISFIVMGQTITLLISYIKRVVLCVMLSVISPLIVAVDTINKSIGKQSNIFNNWIKNFTLTVMMQSFHAMILVVILFIIAGVGSSDATGMQEAIVAIIMTTGLVKFEKMFKQLFGIEDGMMGDLKGAAMKSMAAIHGAKQGIAAVRDNGQKFKDASKKRKTAMKERSWMERENAARKVLANGTSTGMPTNTDPSTLEGLKNQKYVENMNENSDSQERTKANAEKIRAKNELLAIQEEKRQEALKQKDAEIAEHTSKMSSAAFASAMGPANLIAGAGFGIGLGQDVADAFVKGGYITKYLDKAAEKMGERGADYDRSRQYDEAKEKGRENPDVLRKTVSVSQTITNNITPNAKEIVDIVSGKWSDSSHKTASSSRVYKPVKDVDDI